MASRLFELIERDGESAIQDLVARKATEAVDLEFKQKAKPSDPAFDRDDKRNLGSTLSAFANSAGGVLIFGVRATKVDGVDCAQELKPIAGIERFATEAVALASQYLLPRHDGVRVQAVACSDGSGSGYLAVDVERSERRPHQSKAPDDHRYWKRSGDSNFVMEHFDIEDAFKRLAVPELSLRVALGSGGLVTSGGSEIRHLNVDLFLTASVCLARFPFVHVLSAPDMRVQVGDSRSPLDYRGHGAEFRFDGGANAILHVGVEYLACRLVAQVVRDPGNFDWRIGSSVLSPDGLSVTYRMGAQGSRSTEATVSFPGHQIKRAVGL
jgi:hypothetical protein